MISSWLSPVSSSDGGSISQSPSSRKNSAVSIYVGIVGVEPQTQYPPHNYDFVSSSRVIRESVLDSPNEVS